MRTLFLLMVGIACWWGYSNDIHENLSWMYRNRDIRQERDRQLNIIESKVQMSFFDLFSGIIIQPWNGRYDLHAPLDLTSEVRRITRHCVNREERIRAVYRWVTKNIAYDTDYRIYTSDECYRERRGVCSAYSHLMVKMLASIDIPALVVHGQVKKEGKTDLAGHAWVMVDKGNGDYLLADPTWDAGGLDKKTGKFISIPSWKWFDCPPELMIHSHLPDTERHQLLEHPVTREEFERLPLKHPK